MTHGCHFWCRGDKPGGGGGEHAILTPSPTGAGPPVFGHLPRPPTPAFRGSPERTPEPERTTERVGSATALLHRYRPFTGLRKDMVQTLLPCPGPGTHTLQQAS